jgi:Na+-transporting methylmalonyl-CoA/oxaloacetate decarboxylase gamma subunit
MKENQVEFVFIGVIIIVFAIWKISELIKTRCYQAKAIKEGFAAESRDAVKAAAVASVAEEAKKNQQPELMTQLNELLKRNNVEAFLSDTALSTENFTVETPENEMTVNQRKKAATTLDSFKTGTTPPPPPPPVAAPTTDKPINAVKEGLENPDENTKAFIDKNITSITPEDSQSKFKLRDYYIKSAYNAFNPDKFKNSNVSMDALLYVIARGCRFIDFEVFSVENQPVIASSSVNSFNYKETFNHIPVSDAFEVLGSYVFSGSKCPNPGDPFIIHMRMMSRNVTMYDNLAKIISQSKTVARNLLGPKYGREYQSKDLGNEDLLGFKGKIILMVDGTNQVYRNTKLFELINMSSNSLFLSKYTYFGVKNVADPQTFKDANKKNMCLVIPDKGGRPINDGYNGPYTWGCQIAAMCFQEEARDEKLKAYEDKFASVGYAFILKPEDLRYVPITIAPPAPPNPKASMEARPAEAAGGVKITL